MTDKRKKYAPGKFRMTSEDKRIHERLATRLSYNSDGSKNSRTNVLWYQYWQALRNYS